MSRRDIIAIGGSLGAVDAVLQLCRNLPGDLAATLFIAIHVGAWGNNFLAGIFDEQSPLSFSTAEDGAAVRPGHAYVAPADHHLLVINGVIRLGHGPRENRTRPAIDPLFRSVGASFGPRVIAMILSGTLNDGVAGLADVKRCGGLTVVQTPGDAQAPDLPWRAIENSDVDYRVSLSDMAALLAKLSGEEAGPPVEIPADVRDQVKIALGGPGSSKLTPTHCGGRRG